MKIGNRVKVKDPKSVFTGHVGEVMQITSSRRSSLQIWVRFPTHPWQQKNDAPFGFYPHEIAVEDWQRLVKESEG